MPLSTIGDMRQFLITSRANAELKSDLQTLLQELNSGEVADLTAHLGASQTKLTSVDRQLDLLGRFQQANGETDQYLSTMQLALSGIDAQRSMVSEAMLSVTPATSMSQVENNGQISLESFKSVVQTLNLRHADRSMFGGNDLDSAPLSSADVMMNELRASVAGLSGAANIETAIDAWFDDPAGGFETTGYRGDAIGFMSRSVGVNLTIDLDVRADDQALRDTLKALAKGAIAGDSSLTIDLDTRQTMQINTSEDLLTVSSALASLQGRVGQMQGQVEEASVRIAAQQTSYGIARNEMVVADPFETATRLQAVQKQLEIQYTLTARLSRLSLTEYLR